MIFCIFNRFFFWTVFFVSFIHFDIASLWLLDKLDFMIYCFLVPLLIEDCFLRNFDVTACLDSFVQFIFPFYSCFHLRCAILYGYSSSTVYVPPIKESYLIAIYSITGYALCCSKNYAGFLILPRPLCLVGRPIRSCEPPSNSAGCRLATSWLALVSNRLRFSDPAMSKGPKGKILDCRL